MPHDVKESKTLNAIQVKIDNNIRMLAELHARWEREEKEAEIAEKNRVASVWTIFTNENVKTLSTSELPTGPNHTSNKKIKIGEGPTSVEKGSKSLNDTKVTPEKSAENFRVVRNDTPISFDDNEFDFDSCNLTEVIKFLQKLAQTPNASEINMVSLSTSLMLL